MYFIDKLSKIPIYKQLYQELKQDILQSYKPNQKLPSIRKLATLYNISKNSVLRAFYQLEIEGFIEARSKQGYFVNDINYKEFKPKETNFLPPKPKNYRYDFFPAHLEKSTFPHKIWKRLYNKVINEDTNFGTYPDGQGEFELREQIALYLQKSRGANALPQNIVITHGFIDSLNLIAKLLKPKYCHFAMELPGYHIVHKTFSEFGYKISFVDVAKDGIDINKLKVTKAEIVYITPSHQYPLGINMPISKRLELLEYIQSINGIILEDDYDSEMRYNTQPIPALQGLDKDGRVIYLGTFAKALSPAIRVGFILLPDWLISEYKNHFDSHFCHVSIDTQKTLTAFIKEGYLEQHIRRLRNLNRKKHNLMLECLKGLKHYKILAKDGGLSIIITPTKPFDWQKLQDECEKKSIKIYLMKEQSGGDIEALRLGFGGLNLNEIPKAIEELKNIWNKCFL
ncbi:PLP-dependent aminotransferase family protein [Caminibacter mediatlanticus]|uniref:Aminotransferase, MocR-like protein n=1 Tax=Caminibacter mediatlanticus TB-2 TaxID=391592 RepID=A0AAI9AIC1_9BACT|nr:PLP-dependent aminotransferase family protein [Caminibacter mediatlanticus]EDM24009.1 aminotransferase, MocR-like protein [Caminibacter mediatlanticus TB-2]